MKKSAVRYNDYQQFGILHDGTIPWSEKKHLLESKKNKGSDTDIE